MLKLGLPSTKKTIGPKVFLRRLKKSIENQHLAKIYHFFNPFHDVGLYSSNARNIYGKPYIVRIDGIYFDKMETLGSNSEKNKPIFDAIKNANGIIFQSEYNKKQLELFYGDISAKNIIINNGAFINTSKNSYRKELNLNNNDKIIICSAHWRAHKRLKSIIQVFYKLKLEINNLKLIILGKNAQFKEAPDIIYAGEIEPNELYKYYKSANLLLDLSWIDNCPNTFVEAIANGLPVVCSNQGGTKELVEKTNAGIISDCDEDIVLGEYLDLYNPPDPDINKVSKDVLSILNNYGSYKDNINYNAVDINSIAVKYIEFIRLASNY